MMPMLVLEVADYSAVVYALLAAAAMLSFVRLVRGPTLADRAVAVEVLGAIVVAFLVVAAMHRNEGSLIDVALVFALVSFVATLGFARYVLRGPRDV